MFFRALILFIPYLLSSLLTDVPEISYYVAWSGSFFIFYLTFSGFIQAGNYHESVFNTPMRPVVITHVIFASYMALTSIFYFLQSTGYYYFTFDPYYVIDQEKLFLTAECQRYYCLGHAAYVFGIFMFMDYKFKPKYYIEIESVSSFTIKLTFYFTALAFLIRFVPGLTQVAIIVGGLSIVSSVISLAYAIPEGKLQPTLIAGFLFVSNEINALTSGWKEAVVIPIIMLGTYLYPSYKKTITIIIPFILGFYFYFIPTYNNIVRGLSWGGEMEGAAAAFVAVEALQNGTEDIGENNWEFLTTRLSEIGMFSVYVKSFSATSNFYNFTIVEQAVASIIPRVFYSDKPITEFLVMERVVAAGVIDENSVVSAKPPPIVDGYMSGGALGVFLTCLFLGSIASWASSTSEKLFGSYLIGSGLIFTGMFQILWRGNCFEFLVNNLFWSIIFMYLFFYVGKLLKVIKPVL